MDIAKDFEAWWARFPRKVGKLAAQREYVKARKQASAEQLLAGIASYIQAKDVFADYCHPRTFLSQGRWLDEAPAETRFHRWTCPHVVPCERRSQCEQARILGRPEKPQAQA